MHGYSGGQASHDIASRTSPPMRMLPHPSNQPRTLTMASCSCSCVPMAIMCALLVYSCVVAFRVRTSSLASSRADATSPRLAASLTCFCACFSSLHAARTHDEPAGLAARSKAGCFDDLQRARGTGGTPANVSDLDVERPRLLPEARLPIPDQFLCGVDVVCAVNLVTMGRKVSTSNKCFD